MGSQKNNGPAAQAGAAKTGRTVNQDHAKALAPLEHEARQYLDRACKSGTISLGDLDPTVLQDLGRKAAANQLSVVRKLVAFAPNVQKPNKTGLLINIMKRRYKSLPQTPLPQYGSGDSGLSTAEGDSSTEDGEWTSDGVKDGMTTGDYHSSEQSDAGRHILSLVNPAAAAVSAPVKSSSRILELIRGEGVHVERMAAVGKAAPDRKELVSVKDMITGEPGALRVSARGRLASAEVAFSLIRELRVTLLQHRARGKPVGVADLDLSHNNLLMEHFRQIFGLLAKVGARVERFRFYGCTTFDDEIMSLLANYVSGLSAELVPLELHLSDCAITTAGFKSLMHAVDQSSSFPAQPKSGGRPMPLYLRLENNYIDEESIEDCMAAGLLQPLRKAKGRRTTASTSPGTKVSLVVTGSSGFQQLNGPAPAVARREKRPSEAKQAKERAGCVDEITGTSAPAETLEPVDPDWQQAMEIIESCREWADDETVEVWVRQLENAEDPVAEATRILTMSFRLLGQGFCQPSVSSMEEQPLGTTWDYQHGLLLGEQVASPDYSYGADPLEYYGMMLDEPLAYMDETSYGEELAATPDHGRHGGRATSATGASESVEPHLLGLLQQLRGDGSDAAEFGGTVVAPSLHQGSATRLPEQPQQAVPEPEHDDMKVKKKGKNKIGA